MSKDELLIGKYLKAQLRDVELTAFKERMATDETFAQEVRIQKAIIQAIKINDQLEFEERMIRMEKKMAGLTSVEKKTVSEPSGKISIWEGWLEKLLPKIGGNWQPIAIAFSTIVLIMIGYFLFRPESAKQEIVKNPPTSDKNQEEIVEIPKHIDAPPDTTMIPDPEPKKPDPVVNLPKNDPPKPQQDDPSQPKGLLAYADAANPHLSKPPEAPSNFKNAGAPQTPDWVVAYRAQDYQKALQDLEQKFDTDGFNDEVLYYTALCHLYSETYDQAIDAFQKIIDQESQSLQPSIWYSALAYLKLGKKQEAIPLLKKLYLPNLSGGDVDFYHYKEKEAEALVNLLLKK